MAERITRQALYFVAPKQVEVRYETIDSPQPNQLLIRTILSAISPGTERLIYRGDVSSELAVDETLPDLDGSFQYPFKYGYAIVGQVVQIGSTVDTSWLNRLVFAFHPHESYFVTTPDQLMPLPTDISVENAVFLPNMETAVNLVLDGQPIMGEQVVIFGQGVVGLLTTALLEQFPLAQLLTVEPRADRRNLSIDWGALQAISPTELEQYQPKFDLIYELSGQPSALNQAIALANFDGRIVVGSWYGTKPVNLDLGGRFHRQRLRLISSQVSTLSPTLGGRWSKTRRIEWAWQMVQRLQPANLISHRFEIKQAAQAYQLLDANRAKTIQIILTY